MADKTKQCVRCKEDKPLSEFSKDRSQNDGLSFYCKGCQKKIRDARTPQSAKKRKCILCGKLTSERVWCEGCKLIVAGQTKRCCRCKEEKPLFEFSKNRAEKDNLSPQCKSCVKKAKEKCLSRGVAEPVETRCFKCGKTLSEGEWCETCEAFFVRASKNIECSSRGFVGISSWGQVESVVREMAETQASLNEKRDDFIRVAENLVSRQVLCMAMLRQFLVKKCTPASMNKFRRDYRFGDVMIDKGVVRVKLDYELAAKSIGKP